MENNYERLQNREDSKLPPLPDALNRGSEKSILDPVVVHDTALVDSGPRVKPPEEQVNDIQVKIREEQGLTKEFSADDAIGDPQAAIREWQRQKKLGLI